MPSAPNTDDNGTDQPDTDPGTQPGTADSEGEADSTSKADPFPPRGTLTLRALRWAGVVGAVVFGATALLLSRELTEASSAIPDKASTPM